MSESELPYTEQQEEAAIEQVKKEWTEYLSSPAVTLDVEEIRPLIDQTYDFLKVPRTANIWIAKNISELERWTTYADAANNYEDFKRMVESQVKIITQEDTRSPEFSRLERDIDYVVRAAGYRPRLGITNDSWVALYKKYRELGGLTDPQYDFYVELINKGVFAMEMFEDLTIVAPKPRYYFQDSKKHRMDGPAIEFADGTGYFYIENVRIDSEELYWKIVNKTITFREAMAIENIEVRRIALIDFDVVKHLKEIKAKKLDEVTKKVRVKKTTCQCGHCDSQAINHSMSALHDYTIMLFKVPAGAYTDIDELLLVYDDPGTERKYHKWVTVLENERGERVTPKTADEAMALAFKLTVDEYRRLHTQA